MNPSLQNREAGIRIIFNSPPQHCVHQVVDVPLVENSQCETWHRKRGISVILYPEMMCAGYKTGGKDSCKGDSGGPLMVRQKDGRWVLVGLVSAGFSCGQPGQPGIYHR